jgi:hypothetical protein
MHITAYFTKLPNLGRRPKFGRVCYTCLIKLKLQDIS